MLRIPGRALPTFNTRRYDAMRILSAGLLLLLSCAPLLGTSDGGRDTAAVVELRIIAFNRLPGHLEPGDNVIAAPNPRRPGATIALRTGGVAFLASHMDRLRAAANNAIVMSAGDLIGASPLVSALFRDEPTIEAMNLIGLDLNAAGNHEFDQGVDELRRLALGGCAVRPRAATRTCANAAGKYAGARFPFLSANVVDGDGQTLFAPSLVKTFDGAAVGFISAVTRSTPGIVMPAGIRGWRFEREADAINRAARALRARGVSALVLVIHEGGETDGGYNDCDHPRGEIFDIERALDPEIAVVFSAHTHRAYVCKIGTRVVVQGASFGRLLSVVDVALDRASGQILRERTRARNEPVVNDRNGKRGADSDADADLARAFPALPARADVAALVEDYRRRAAPLAQQPAGRIAATFSRRADEGGDFPAGRLIADAQLAATRTQGAQIAFTNPGGVRADLVAHNDGTVSYSDLFTMQPFGNSLVTMTLNGAQLKALLEMQWRRTDAERARMLQPSRGFSYAWRRDAPYGERIVAGSLRLNGELIGASTTVRVTVNSFLAAGGDGFRILHQGRDAAGGPLDIDALANHVRERSASAPLAPDPDPRIVRI